MLLEEVPKLSNILGWKKNGLVLFNMKWSVKRTVLFAIFTVEKLLLIILIRVGFTYEEHDFGFSWLCLFLCEKRFFL